MLEYTPDVRTTSFLWSQKCGVTPCVHHGFWMMFNIRGKGVVHLSYRKRVVAPMKSVYNWGNVQLAHVRTGVNESIEPVPSMTGTSDFYHRHCKFGLCHISGQRPNLKMFQHFGVLQIFKQPFWYQFIALVIRYSWAHVPICSCGANTLHPAEPLVLVHLELGKLWSI